MRFPLVTAPATALATASAIALATGVVAAQSPMFRGGPAHDGVSASTPPSLTEVVWKFETGGPVLSTPAIVDGVAYVGSTDHRVYAIRIDDGTEVWRVETGLDVRSSPAVSGGLVYFGSRDGKVYAVRAATGEAVWTFETGGERRFTAPGIHGLLPRTEVMPDPFDVFTSSPVVAEGTVFIGSGDRHVYALDALTGEQRWAFETGDVVHATPAVANGMVYIGSWDRNMYALRADTGAVVWRFETGDDTNIYNQVGIASSAAVADGTVLFGCRDGHFYALDAATGEQRWAEDNRGGWVIASPAVRNGIVYFPTSDGTQFKAIRVATGELLWRTVNRNISFSSPALAGNTVYFGTHDGLLNALDAATGAERPAFRTDGHTTHAPTYLDESGSIVSARLFPDRTLDGVIIGLERQFRLGSVLSSPVVADGVVYFGSTDGHVYAVR